MRRLGVLGWPVAHSRSPAMHRAALAALGLSEWSYQKLPCPPELFEQTVRALPAAGFVGVNVTIPHKEAALALADTVDDDTRAIGAANTLSFDPSTGAIHAQNTDAPGTLAAVAEHVQLRGARATVLGAGGSARAVVHALVGAGAEVSLWNRTPERAGRVADDLGARAVDSPGAGDVLVNCTSIGLDGSSASLKQFPLDADALAEHQCVVDLVYGTEETALIAHARRRGCAVVDGLEVLVRQGALSLETWTGCVAPLAAMREGARGRPTTPDPPDD